LGDDDQVDQMTQALVRLMNMTVQPKLILPPPRRVVHDRSWMT